MYWRQGLARNTCFGAFSSPRAACKVGTFLHLQFAVGHWGRAEIDPAREGERESEREGGDIGEPELADDKGHSRRLSLFA